MRDTLHRKMGEITDSNEEFLKVLRKTKPNKAVGPDGVRPDVQRTCVETVVQIAMLHVWSLTHALYGSNDLENVLCCPSAKEVMSQNTMTGLNW